MRVLILPLFVIASVACAEPTARPTELPAPTGPGPSTIVPDPAPAPSTSTEATAAPAEVRPGSGSCRSDADCVVSGTLDPAEVGTHACCSYICPPGRVISRALEAPLQARRDQACRAPPMCPPPAPCRKTDVVLVPRCQEQRCVGEVQRRPAKREPEQ